MASTTAHAPTAMLRFDLPMAMRARPHNAFTLHPSTFHRLIGHAPT